MQPANNESVCCWPAQAWSSERGACVGDPKCPEGLEAGGDACVSGVAGVQTDVEPPVDSTASKSLSDAIALMNVPISIGPLGGALPVGVDRIAIRQRDGGAPFHVTYNGTSVCDLPCSMWAGPNADLALTSLTTKRPLRLSLYRQPRGASLDVTAAHSDPGLIVGGAVLVAAGLGGVAGGIYGVVKHVTGKNVDGPGYIIGGDLGIAFGAVGVALGSILISAGRTDSLSVHQGSVHEEQHSPVVSLSPFGARVDF